MRKSDELQAELADVRAENARLKYLLDLGHSGLIKELKDAESDNARLRDALEAVEWVEDDIYMYCPWCDKMYAYVALAHADDCQRQEALK